MKFASSSGSFAGALASGDLTQLEWLDLCAAELELDGVVLDARHFPRSDGDYFAQLKKTAADLGLTVAGLAFEGALADGGAWLEAAVALGAPLLVVQAPLSSDTPDAWGAFSDELKALAGRAKHLNVPLALRNRAGTLCASGADLKHAAKDADSSWVRFTLAAMELQAVDAPESLLPKTVLARHEIDDAERFVTSGEAARLIEKLAGFRGFVTLERSLERGPRDAFHRALLHLRAAYARAVLLMQDS